MNDYQMDQLVELDVTTLDPDRSGRFIKIRNKITAMLDSVRFNLNQRMDSHAEQGNMLDGRLYNLTDLTLVTLDRALSIARNEIELSWLLDRPTVISAVKEVIRDHLPTWWEDDYVQSPFITSAPPNLINVLYQDLIDKKWYLNEVLDLAQALYFDSPLD